MCSFEHIRTVNTAYIFHTYIRFYDLNFISLYHQICLPHLSLIFRNIQFSNKVILIFLILDIYTYIFLQNILPNFFTIRIYNSNLLKNLKITLKFLIIISEAMEFLNPMPLKIYSLLSDFFLCVSYLEKSTYPTKFLFIHTLFPP